MNRAVYRTSYAMCANQWWTTQCITANSVIYAAKVSAITANGWENASVPKIYYFLRFIR